MAVEFALRAWQARFAKQLAAHDGDDFLLVAAPGSGKTLGSGAALGDVMAARRCDQLIVVGPTSLVRDQWVRDLGQLGYRMVMGWDGRLWPGWTHGASVTYQQVANRPDRFREACEQRRTVVLIDEVHHAGEDAAWGEALRNAFAGAHLRLCLSGTPFRSDTQRIPFVRFDETGRAQPDFVYGYAQAVRDGVCRPVRFRTHDGEITWEHREQRYTARFSEKIQRRRAQRLRASLDPSQPYLRSLLTEAHEDLVKLRRRTPDAGGLVVCDSQQHATQIAGLLEWMTGTAPVVAMSDLPQAHDAIRGFVVSDAPWLVSVRMVSEGVDVPRLAVVAWVTAASTEMLVRQVAGRVVRGRPGEELTAVVHMPADPRLVQHARRIETATSPRWPRKEGSHSRGQEIPRGSCRAISARAVDTPGTISIAAVRAPAVAAAEPVVVAAPELPPSPQDLRRAEERRQDRCSEVLRQLGVYAELRRLVDPAFMLPAAHRELVEDVGVIGPETSPEMVQEALNWVNERLRSLARKHPRALRDLAQQRRVA